eukprot:CAMPEP_0175155062 /NCGR_PEP_ID=MMETSP0087-20121206/20738_1 /TAXON_ID=136419 /ORGANISM="Unknown Unknown, Strain D1" /LENGTH=122 /DNA_ID=CAMNT_0016442119 /DNA_START=114 /DNA_END=479 /DNA_ORIENTATION=-
MATNDTWKTFPEFKDWTHTLIIKRFLSFSDEEKLQILWKDHLERFGVFGLRTSQFETAMNKWVDEKFQESKNRSYKNSSRTSKERLSKMYILDHKPPRWKRLPSDGYIVHLILRETAIKVAK